ncbi:uncharacterized protein LOC127646911 [Xyrauchen texanus]|uniref:uncharacterized protein LOC127646911 n=1 Tax=Xyrauchen texanus TaxID=154827 RepID=UPI002242B0F1|nr:uncharacterized protein LOC127646911 [Xyrauchen texanus]
MMIHYFPQQDDYFAGKLIEFGMSHQNSSYSRPSPMRCVCVANRTVRRGTSFVQEGAEVKITAFKMTTTSALSTGIKFYLAPKSGEEAGFEENATYVIKNYTLSFKFGHECIFVGPSSSIFKTAPIPLAEEARARAQEALCPPSCWTSGEDSDVFTKGGYVTLSGYVERLQAVRMTPVKEGEVPILPSENWWESNRGFIVAG